MNNEIKSYLEETITEEQLNIPAEIFSEKTKREQRKENHCYELSSGENRYDSKDIIDNGKSILKREIDLKNMDDVLFYVCKDSNLSGDIYAIDKLGNLITKINASTLSNYNNLDNDDVKILENDRVIMINAINEAKEQINFMSEQSKIKEEISGYPEYNERIFELYKPHDIKLRFKNEKNLLRAMLKPNGDYNDFRLLLSIVREKDIDYFNQLVDDKILNSTIFPISPVSHSRIIFCAIQNFITLYNQFPSIKTLVNAIKIPYSKEFFDEYLYDEKTIDIIIQKRYLELRKTYCRHVSEVLKKDLKVSDEIIEKLRQAEFMTLPPSSDSLFDNLQSVFENKLDNEKLSTGIKILDQNNAYIKKGKISTVFAYTGNFKTMFCSNVAYNAIKNNSNVLYLSLEISKAEMYINFLSRHSYNFDKKISHSDIKNSKLSDDDKDYLYNTIYTDFKNELKSNLIVYDETDIDLNTYASFSKLFYQADSNFKKKTGKGIDLIIIDHLNLLKFESGEKIQNDYSAVNHWMSFFRKNTINFLGQKRQIAILCACQSSREGYKNAMKNQKYQLTGIAEGNEIERSSQLVLSIYTTDEYRNNNKSQMQILKLRDDKPTDQLLDVGLDPKYYMFGIEVEQAQSLKNNETSMSYEKLENDCNIISAFE